MLYQLDGMYCYYKVSVNGGTICVNALSQSNACCYFSKAEGSYIQFKAPFTGRYTRLGSQLSISHFERIDGSFKDAQQSYGASSATFYSTGSFIRAFNSSLWSSSYPYAFGNSACGVVEFYTPVYSVEPSEAITVSTNYASSTRPHSFDDTTIIDEAFNETANTFYDMAAGSTYTMSKWSYDYPTRTYTVTLEDETTVTVQYGDQAMIVTSGAAANSYPYSVPSGGGTDPDPDPDTPPAYDVYTCSRCGRTYEDRTGNGAPDEDYSTGSISQLVVRVFSKLGTFAGKLIGFLVHLFDKALGSVDHVISKFNDYTAQISGFGENYPTWLSGFWGILPAELQVALTFAVLCMVLGVVGKKLFFS